MRKRAGFWVYNDLLDRMTERRFNFEQAGRLMLAMFRYSFSRTCGYEYNGMELKNAYGELDPKLLEVFKCFRKDFDEDFRKVLEKSERMKRNGSKGGIAKAKKMREKEAGEDEQ